MKLKPLPEITETIEQELAPYPQLVRRLLVNRNITTSADAYRFLVTSYEKDTHDPFLLKDMEKTVLRIKEAISSNQKIAVYSDYDCDGIPGAVIMKDFFDMLGYQNYIIYIPDRHKEGYGLQIDALTKLIAQDVKLIITVDLGITNIAEVDFCMKQGVDVVVTDHHLPAETIPPAFAVVNPKQVDCDYPDPMLCGSGVAFKCVQGFLSRFGEEFKVPFGKEKWLLDMVGLATLSDMVPLVNENRIFAQYGLLVFRKTRRKGLLYLLKKANIQVATIGEEDITFMVSPRINAAGRMDHPRHAFTLLSTHDDDEARAKSDLLDKYNQTRKNLVKTIMKQSIATLEKRNPKKVIVVGDRRWAVGVLGLVASKLVERYNKPVFVWGGGDENDDDKVLKGSCRSSGEVNIVELMNASASSFVSFGGHEMAGGFSVSLDAVHTLEDTLALLYDTHKKDISQEKEIYYDALLSFDDIGESLYSEISKLAPFGVGNPKPVFLFRDSMIHKLKIFGKQNEHLELSFKTSTGRFVKAIAFFANHESFSVPLKEGISVSLLASVEKSFFGYSAEIRLRIEGIYGAL